MFRAVRLVVGLYLNLAVLHMFCMLRKGMLGFNRIFMSIFIIVQKCIFDCHRFHKFGFKFKVQASEHGAEGLYPHRDSIPKFE